MSQEVQAPKTAEEAKIFFAREVTYPIFLQKLAETHPQFAPRNEHQAESLCRIGSRLLQADHLNQEKQAADGLDFLAQAEQGLERVMAEYYQQVPQQELWIQKAAGDLSDNPIVQAAAKTIEATLQAA